MKQVARNRSFGGTCRPYLQGRRISQTRNQYEESLLFLCQRVNTATTSPAEYVHHYAIPQKLVDPIFNKLPVFMRQWEKEKAVLYPVEGPPP
jgi:hypothetical protein